MEQTEGQILVWRRLWVVWEHYINKHHYEDVGMEKKWNCYHYPMDQNAFISPCKLWSYLVWCFRNAL